jgi:peptidoglycan glycosyltransferase
LGAVFIALFVVLALRQLWIQVVEGPALADNRYNPRHATTAVGRGSILASDGTPLAVSRGDKRLYPQGALVAHAVGYASARYGTSGLEDAFDRVLTPRGGAQDPFSQLTEMLASTHRPPRGADVVTTLDLRVQRSLVAQLQRYPRAAGIVIDPRTGAVLAIASVPSYDPNALDARWAQLLADPASPLLDRSTSGLYPPGSTFKIVTVADALDAERRHARRRCSTTPAALTIGNFTVRNDEEEVTGLPRRSPARSRSSSNVDFARVALEMGVDRWFDVRRPLGLGPAGRFRSAGCARSCSRPKRRSARGSWRSWVSAKPRCWSRRCAWRSSGPRSRHGGTTLRPVPSAAHRGQRHRDRDPARDDRRSRSRPTPRARCATS